MTCVHKSLRMQIFYTQWRSVYFSPLMGPRLSHHLPTENFFQFFFVFLLNFSFFFASKIKWKWFEEKFPLLGEKIFFWYFEREKRKTSSENILLPKKKQFFLMTTMMLRCFESIFGWIILISFSHSVMRRDLGFLLCAAIKKSPASSNSWPQ